MSESEERHVTTELLAGMASEADGWDAAPALGVFRRRIGIRAHGDAASGFVRAALEDDFHHFRVEVTHAQGQVESVSGFAVRQPWTACHLASAGLRDLVGMPLNRVASAVTRVTEAATQCTHQLDLAGLAIACAARGDAAVDYRVTVPRRVAGATHARLMRDGRLFMACDVQDNTLVGPPPFAGVSLHQGFARWAYAELDEIGAEAALVLRRCVLISLGRAIDLDAIVSATPRGRCFVEQPVRAPTAMRVVGSTWDFSPTPEALLAGDQAWLAANDEASPGGR